MESLSLIAALLTIIGVMILVEHLDSMRFKNLYQKILRTNNEWLERNKNNIAYVEFVPHGKMSMSSEVLQSDLVYDCYFPRPSCAKDKARDLLEQFYKQGYFVDKNGNTYPTYEVSIAYVVEEIVNDERQCK